MVTIGVFADGYGLFGLTFGKINDGYRTSILIDNEGAPPGQGNGIWPTTDLVCRDCCRRGNVDDAHVI